MKEIVVISGKGGTGKTSIAASLAAIAGDVVLVDCDADAANMHLLTSPEILETHDFVGMQKAAIDPDKCIGCGRCKSLCRFGAVCPDNGRFMIDSSSCEGCGLCYEICPVKAVRMEDNVNGHWHVSETRFGPLVHARLTPGEDNCGKLVAELKKQGRRIANERSSDFLIVDGSPGIGCPVIASISSADMALIVTEPSSCAIHDMKRVHKLSHTFNVATAICINRADINKEMTLAIERFAEQENIPVVGRLNYDAMVTESQMHGKTIIEYASDIAISAEIRLIWQRLAKVFKEGFNGSNRK